MRGAFKATQSAPTPSPTLSPSLSLLVSPQMFLSVTSLLPFFFFPSSRFLSPSLALLLRTPFLSFSLLRFPCVLLFILPFLSPSLLFLSLKFLFSFFSPVHSLFLFRPPLRSVCMTHFLGPGPINHSVVGSACLPPCLAALPHHSR